LAATQELCSTMHTTAIARMRSLLRVCGDVRCN